MRSHSLYTDILPRFLCFVALLCLPVGAVIAHGSALWIEQQDYRDSAGTPCCGPKDCTWLKRSAVERVGDSYKVTLNGVDHYFPEDQTQRHSHDEHPWVCMDLESVEIRCLLMPESGWAYREHEGDDGWYGGT